MGEVGDIIALQDLVTKGHSGREIAMAAALRQALVEWRAVTPRPGPNNRIVVSECDPGLSANSVRIWFAFGLADRIVQQAVDAAFGEASLSRHIAGGPTPARLATAATGSRAAEFSTIRAKARCSWAWLRSATIASR